ncbi:tRNA (adenine37-N(6))-methyltransferase TrmN6 [hydrothermal vent metagenome]|uniref:tRNA (Adenine37-N(6))-methyltransferase TrmN6 n=1 Tax=hydrothermal vent metagenome TaxID=652676 RepID=A0A3B0TIA3_9ZZZZ
MVEEIAFTEDEFLSGRIKAIQSKKGFRSGIDTVLLAASVDLKSTNIAEFGAGSGIASCCVLADLTQANATLIDFNADALGLADKNLKKNGFSKRAKTLLLDVTNKGSVREEAGLKNNYYTSIIANPPFFDAKAGTISPQIARADSRHMQNDDLDKWVKCAASSAAAGGEVIFIHSIGALPRLLGSFSARFGNISVLPISSRPQQNTSRVLIRGIKGSRAPMSLLAPLVLHGPDGNSYLEQADAIFRGKSRISWKNTP